MRGTVASNPHRAHLRCGNRRYVLIQEPQHSFVGLYVANSEAIVNSVVPFGSRAAPYRRVGRAADEPAAFVAACGLAGSGRPLAGCAAHRGLVVQGGLDECVRGPGADIGLFVWREFSQVL